MNIFNFHRIIAASALSVALLAVGCADPVDVSQDQVTAWIGQGQAPLLLDVRSQEEFGSGHIPGSVNIPVDQLAARLQQIEDHRDREVVVYCERGGRAQVAREITISLAPVERTSPIPICPCRQSISSRLRID